MHLQAIPQIITAHRHLPAATPVLQASYLAWLKPWRSGLRCQLRRPV